MIDDSVTFKGTVNGLIIVMKEEESIDTIMDQIEKRIQSAGRFFNGASLSVKYKGKKLTEEERQKILDLLSEKSGAEIKSLSEEIEDLYESNLGDAEYLKNYKPRMRDYFFKGIDEGHTKFHRGTVRSGRLVSFDGNIVVIGDVNPGGEVIATGNVVVMGSLRGMVHAGADGNKDAIIVAFNLQPMQLRIADVITRPPDEIDQLNTYTPELAYVKDDSVYIERFLPQFK